MVICIASPVIAGEQTPIKPDEAIPVVSWEQADLVVGRVAKVRGFILGAGSSGSFVFLNFDQKKPGKFTALIPTANLSQFEGDPQKAYQFKFVEVRGLVTTYQDRPQIKVTEPSQITVLSDESQAKVAPYAPPAFKELSSTITIATYNVLNLFDPVDDPYHDDASTPTKPREQLELVARQIRRANADIIAFQEVENRWYLKRFVDVFLADMGYRYFVHFEGNDLRGIDVCLVSRVPVGPVTSHRHLKFKSPDGKERRMSRDVLAVTLWPSKGEPFEVWVLHLKSNFGGREYAESIRVAEAKLVRRLLDERLKDEADARIIVCGDFNDVFESSTLKTLIGTGKMRMHTFFEAIPESQRITYNREPYRSMIDFIIASEAVAKRYVGGSYAIFDGTVESSGSDHNLVLAKFELN